MNQNGIHPPETLAAQHSPSSVTDNQMCLRNILFVFENLTIVGGVQVFLLQALRHLPELGFQPYILDIGSETTALTEQFVPFEPFILRAPELSQRGTTLWSTGVAAQLQKLDIELVVLNEWVYSRLLQDIPAALPVIAICHVDSDEQYYYSLPDLLAHRLHAVVAVSETIAQKLCQVMPAERRGSVQTIRYGLEGYVTETRQERAAPPPLRLIYLGRLVQKQKRIYDLIPFVKTLNTLGVNYHLTIVGAGEAAADLKAALADEIASSLVNFTGPLPHDQAMIELSRQHLCLLFSEYEGSPISVLEALACGVAPVVTNGLIPELLVDGVNARLFPVGRPEIAAAMAAELAHDPAALDTLSRQALALGSQFKSEETFRRYAQLFAEATAQAGDRQSWWTDGAFRRRQRVLAVAHKALFAVWPAATRSAARPFAERLYSGLRARLWQLNN